MEEGGFEIAGEKPCFDFVDGRGRRDGSQEDADQFLSPLTNGLFVRAQRMTPVILLHQVFGVYVFFRFPRVV